MGKIRRGLTQDLLPHVRKVLGFSGISVVFQPIVDLKKRQLFAYEALVRPKHPNFGNPIALFEEAIARDCCGELGRLIREIALESYQAGPIFLNVHPKEMDDGWLLRPDDPMFRHPYPVYLEITESVPLSHELYCHGSLREVRQKGIYLAVDDLGAGYSNLKYIADLAPEIVKLDRKLIADLTSDSRLFVLVRAVTRLCSDLGAKVVAEGIETASELEAVREAGVDFGQGYFIARPAFPPPSPQHL